MKWFKIFAFVLCMALLFPNLSSAQDKSVTLAWDYNLVNNVQYPRPDGFNIVTDFSVYVSNVSMGDQVIVPPAWGSLLNYPCQVTRDENGDITNVVCTMCAEPGTGSNVSEDPNSSECRAVVTNLQEGQIYYFAATAKETGIDSTVMAESPYSLEISYTVPLTKFTIVSSAGSNGMIDPLGTIEYDRGSTVTYNIVPITGYKVSDVNVDGSSQGAIDAYIFSNIQANHTINATFTIQTFTIIATAGSGGSISPVGTTAVNYNGTQTYNISANVGYDILDVSVDGVSQGPVTSYTFNNVTTNHTINVTFVVRSYTIVASAGAGGSISPSGNVPVPHSADQLFTIVPSSGYRIGNVMVDGVSQGVVSSYTFTNVTSGHSISVTFVRTYPIYATAGTGGSINPNGTVYVDEGYSQTFSITPETGYRIDNVLVDSSPVGTPSTYTFGNVTNGHSIEAQFALLPVTFTVTKSVNNSGGYIDGPDTVTQGSTATYTFVVYEGYRCVNIKVDGAVVSCTSSYTFENVQSNHTLVMKLSPPKPKNLRMN